MEKHGKKQLEKENNTYGGINNPIDCKSYIFNVYGNDQLTRNTGLRRTDVYDL